jgi:hypothetical protein
MLVPGRAPQCDAALTQGGAVGCSDASHSQQTFMSTKWRYTLDASLRLADRRGRVVECVSALTR